MAVGLEHRKRRAALCNRRPTRPCSSHEAISGLSSTDFKPSSERLCLNFAEIARCSLENESGGCETMSSGGCAAERGGGLGWEAPIKEERGRRMVLRGR